MQIKESNSVAFRNLRFNDFFPVLELVHKLKGIMTFRGKINGKQYLTMQITAYIIFTNIQGKRTLMSASAWRQFHVILVISYKGVLLHIWQLASNIFRNYR